MCSICHSNAMYVKVEHSLIYFVFIIFCYLPFKIYFIAKYIFSPCICVNIVSTVTIPREGEYKRVLSTSFFNSTQNPFVCATREFEKLTTIHIYQLFLFEISLHFVSFFQIAIYGKNFCASAKDAFFLIVRNCVRYVEPLLEK